MKRYRIERTTPGKVDFFYFRFKWTASLFAVFQPGRSALWDCHEMAYLDFWPRK